MREFCALGGRVARRALAGDPARVAVRRAGAHPARRRRRRACSDRAQSVTPVLLDALARRGTRHAACSAPRSSARRPSCATSPRLEGVVGASYSAAQTLAGGAGVRCATTPRRIPARHPASRATRVVIGYRNGVEALLQAFEQEHGDLSDGRRRLRAAARAPGHDAARRARPDGRQPPGRGLVEPRAPRARVGLGPAGAPRGAVGAGRRPVARRARADELRVHGGGRTLPAGYAASVGGDSQPAIVHVKRVPSSRGARPPGRSPRRTSTVVTSGSTASAVRAGPRPSRRQRSVRPTTTSPAASRPPTSAAWRGLDDHRLGGDAEPALDGERRVREQPAGVAPARCPCSRPRAAARAPRARASQAPSSTAAQSCSAARERHEHRSARGGRAPTRTPTSHGASSSSASRRASSSRPSGASTTSSSTSCSVASRARSRPGVTDVNAAVRAVTPSSANRSRSSASCATAPPSSAALATDVAMTSSRSEPPASSSPSATSAGNDPVANAACHDTTRIGCDRRLARRRASGRRAPDPARESRAGRRAERRPARSRAPQPASCAPTGTPPARRPGARSDTGPPSAAPESARAADARRPARRAPRPARRRARTRDPPRSHAPARRPATRPGAPRRSARRLVGEIRQSRPTPERERGAELRARDAKAPLGQRPRPGARPALEDLQVQRAVGDHDDVSASPSHDRIAAQGLAQLRHVGLQHVPRGDRRVAAPDLVHQPRDRHDLVRVHEQDRQQRSLPRTADARRNAAHKRLERPENAELETHSERA